MDTAIPSALLEVSGRLLSNRAVRSARLAVVLCSAFVVVRGPGKLQGIFQRLLSVLGVRVQVQGKRLEEPHLAVCNHISYLDVACLGSLAHYRFVAKSEVARWPVIGRFAKLSECIFVNRNHARSTAQGVSDAGHQIGQGRSVLVFPEGTTTSGASVLPFRPVFFEAAKLLNCRVQPIAIRYDSPRVPFIGDDSLVPHLWQLMAEHSITVHISFCTPIPADSHRADLAAKSWQAVAAALQNERFRDAVFVCEHA